MLSLLHQFAAEVVKIVNVRKEVGNVAVIAVACVCVVLPHEISQLFFAVAGALVFAIVQSLQASKQKKFAPACTKGCFISPKKLPAATQRNELTQMPRPSIRQISIHLPICRDAVKRPSASPIQAPKFECVAWDLQVLELLQQITPSAEDDKIVAKIASLVKQVIKHMFPGVEVVGFTSGDLARKKAFAVAVPDVDIVANVNPALLAEQLATRLGPFHGALDPKKLQKSAIRLCTDKLVCGAGFKFRRSAFRGDEPKVTLLVPMSLGLGVDAIPINFSVNAVTPLHNAALLTECGLLENRAKELILLVKRWAKDRGIAHCAKGHLSPYEWALLCIFFLQAGMPDGESLLPNLSGFKKVSCLMRRGANLPATSPTGSNKNIADLFREFMHFYCKIFDWENEAISIWKGKRGSANLSMKLHIIVDEQTKATIVGPSVEDPFDGISNLAEGITGSSFSRLREELDRAYNICSSDDCSLAVLLEPWAPVDVAIQDKDQTKPPCVPPTVAPIRAVNGKPSIAPWRKQAVCIN